LGADSGDDAVSDEERLMLHLNLAMCNLKLGDNDSAVEDCDHALEIDSGNVKGLFRRGCAYLKLNNLEAAAADLRKAQELDPTNAGVKKELRALALQQKAAKEKEREMAARMFG
jgi:peptidyl-prolyl isomerase D